MRNGFLTRQQELLPEARLNDQIFVLGAGAVGSFTILSLTKMGMNNVYVWDDDKIEEHNLPNQFYKISDIGKFKVDALKEIVYDFSETVLNVNVSKFTGFQTYTPEITIVTVDNMKTRIDTWKEVKEKNTCKLFIDTRMGAQILRIYPVLLNDPKCIEFYETNLYPDSEMVQERCTAKTIIYTVNVMSGMVCALVSSYLNDRQLPFEILFDTKTFTWTSYNGD